MSLVSKLDFIIIKPSFEICEVLKYKNFTNFDIQ